MRVVITGASRGIGRATALKLAADGAEALTLCDVAYLDELEALAPTCSAAGCKVRTLKADMARPSEPRPVVPPPSRRWAASMPSSATPASPHPASWSISTSRHWDRIFDVNLRANWLLAKSAIRI